MSRIFRPDDPDYMTQKEQATHLKWTPLTDSTVLSEVDLIVPFHGQYEHVGRLIETLWESTRGVYYNVCLVDDGSPNRDFMERIEGMKVPSMAFARHDTRRGFGASLNTGLAATKSPWVVFLNSDVWFDNGGWLHHLGETYHRYKDKGVKMVSARVANPPPGDPRVDSAAGDTGDAIIEASGFDQIAGEDRYLPFVCVLAHRELFNRIGPVKEYPLGWYEDVEFACRMWSKGYRQAICGAATVQHAGGATVNAICESDRKTKKIFESNFDLCCRDINALKRS